MAITYFTIISTDPNPTVNLDCPAAVEAKLIGIIRVCFASNHTPSTKCIVVGEDIVAGDSARLRSITTARKNAIVAELQKSLNFSRAQLADYGRSLGREFWTAIDLPDATVNAL